MVEHAKVTNSIFFLLNKPPSHSHNTPPFLMSFNFIQQQWKFIKVFLVIVLALKSEKQNMFQFPNVL